MMPLSSSGNVWVNPACAPSGTLENEARDAVLDVGHRSQKSFPLSRSAVTVTLDEGPGLGPGGVHRHAAMRAGREQHDGRGLARQKSQSPHDRIERVGRHHVDTDGRRVACALAREDPGDETARDRRRARAEEIHDRRVALRRGAGRHSRPIASRGEPSASGRCCRDCHRSASSDTPPSGTRCCRESAWWSTARAVNSSSHRPSSGATSTPRARHGGQIQHAQPQTAQEADTLRQDRHSDPVTEDVVAAQRPNETHEPIVLSGSSGVRTRHSGWRSGNRTRPPPIAAESPAGTPAGAEWPAPSRADAAPGRNRRARSRAGRAPRSTEAGEDGCRADDVSAVLGKPRPGDAVRIAQIEPFVPAIAFDPSVRCSRRTRISAVRSFSRSTARNIHTLKTVAAGASLHPTRCRRRRHN